VYSICAAELNLIRDKLTSNGFCFHGRIDFSSIILGFHDIHGTSVARIKVMPLFNAQKSVVQIVQRQKINKYAIYSKASPHLTLNSYNPNIVRHREQETRSFFG
jgi:hypothetical protein